MVGHETRPARGPRAPLGEGAVFMTQPKPTIVLVHGAWADGYSWINVIQPLQAAGHDVVTLPNTLRGAAANSAVIRSYLDTIDGPVVLVAHSYGGFVITNAAKGAANVKALVYVDAFIPDEGQNAAVLASQASVLTAALTDPTKVFKLVPIPGAPPDVLDTYLLPQVVSGSFANDVSAAEAKLIHATQRPASLAGLLEPSGPRHGRTSRRGRSSESRTGSSRRTRSVRWPSMQARGSPRSTPRTVSMVSHPQIVVIEEALQEVGCSCRPPEPALDR